MNWHALKTEISKPDYAGMTDSQIADMINAKSITSTRPYFASVRTIYHLFGPTQAKLIVDTIHTSDPNIYSMLTQVGPVDGQSGGIDVSLPETQVFVDQLVTGGVMTEADKSVLVSLGITSAPWRVSALGQNEPVSADQVAFARTLEVLGE